MWRCSRCGEVVDESFRVCWNCGTSEDGIEDPDFRAEVDVAETEVSYEANRRWNGFWAGASVTTLTVFLYSIIPFLIAFPNDLAVRSNFGGILIARSVLSLIVGIGGGICGWIGCKTPRVTLAACTGAPILLVLHGVLVLLSGGLWLYAEVPVLKVIASLVNISVLGAIAGSIGMIFGRDPSNSDASSDQVQYSLSEILFITTLFGLLLSSLAVMAK